MQGSPSAFDRCEDALEVSVQAEYQQQDVTKLDQDLLEPFSTNNA